MACNRRRMDASGVNTDAATSPWVKRTQFVSLWHSFWHHCLAGTASTNEVFVIEGTFEDSSDASRSFSAPIARASFAQEGVVVSERALPKGKGARPSDGPAGGRHLGVDRT